MYYHGLKNEKVADGERKRISRGLIRLRAQLTAQVPARTIEDNLLLATWNIRELGGGKFGGRARDAFYFIAEIIDHFDLVAIQEVREDMRELEEIRRLLGSWWKMLVTDVTYGTAGNNERLAYLYDSRTVRFADVAGEIVLPPRKGDDAGFQMARTPFLCSFKSAWTNFDLCSVHIYYGDEKADDPRRVKEIGDLAKLLCKEIGREPDDPLARNLIVLGDFNIFDRATDKTMKALESAGFVVPPEIRATKTNALGDKEYDQIAFLKRDARFALSGRGGVLDYYESVFRDDQEAEYKTVGTHGTTAYKTWRTYQMSDHRLLWVELKTDFSHDFLSGMTA